MKFVAVRVDNTAFLDLFMRRSYARFIESKKSVKLFISGFRQKKIVLPEGKAFYICAFDATFLDLAPKFLIKYGLKNGLKKCGYVGEITFIQPKYVLYELINTS